MTLKAQSAIVAPPLEEREWRYRRIRKEMEKAGLDGLLIYAPSWRRENFRYVTGAALQSSVALAYLPATGAPTAFVLSAEDERATKAAGFVEDVRRVTLASPAEIADRLREGGAPEKIGVAGWDFLPASLLAGLKEAAPGAAFVNGTMIGDKVRLVKSDWEIQKLRRAGEICDAAWLAFLEAIVPGAHEFDIVANVEAKLRSMGGADNFMLIASGGDDVRGMTPPTDRKLQKGDMVRTELTPQWDGYWTQICRSAVMGPASDAQKKSFDLFNESVAAGIDVIKPGVTAHDIAKAENDVFRKYGYGEYCTAEYTRVRGHCLGLYLDEVLILEGVETVLEENSVLIVHPNTYTPIAGYHVLGDSVVVTKNGAEKLFKTPRQLDEVPV
ncbi:M24 family metallopeptidase [Marinicaulis aureus]|uniref:M24 family metallopeptidase n=1 Tax=Hyphococcus aureus TaxID=2666033 RepID=A0ABW1L426_9PROT